MDLTDFDAVLFDKDGTLFDFHDTWSGWASQAIHAISDGEPVLSRAVAAALGFDLDGARFDAGSPAVAGTPEDLIALLRPVLPQMPREVMLAHLRPTEATLVPAAVPDLRGTLDHLRARGLKLGVVTNDFEAAARVQLTQAGIHGFFSSVVGYDSGFGGKPAPDGCLGAARALGVPPERVIMVGDSLHDLHAGRAAGMGTIGVLTGTALRADLAGHADIICDDIRGMRLL